MLERGVFWFVLALLLALVEIEIEGKFGWAEKLPTWYRKKGLFARIFRTVNPQRPLTGYHLFMQIFLVLVFHVAFFIGLSWSLRKEFELLAIILIFFSLWDFLWFVFNPAYTIKNYKKDKVWWFSKSYWISGLFPFDYVKAAVISLILAYLAGIFVYQIELIGLLLIFSLISILFAPLYHKWYKKMRRRDERKLVEIFH